MSTLPNAIGRFEVVDRIGQGGMGALLLAWDPLLERQIAIKLLKESDNEELRARFTREARAVARLFHPHIVTIFDVGEHQGQPFIAMEYIKGHTLADYVRRPEPVQVLTILEWIGDMCDALGYAHLAGIVHRDVKPANVMVDSGGIKILDFGIARVAESGMTQKGLLIGTLNYMSPEQLMGGALDGRSDMFAVGAVFYELLCRRQAFPGTLDSGVLARIMHQQPDPVDRYCVGIDPAVVRIVQTALQKDPADRYPDLAAMGREVRHVHRVLSAQADQQSTASPDGTTIMFDPQTPVRTPRRGTSTDEFVKRREVQIEQHLQEASAALAAADYEHVVAACEQALLMDPNLTRAARMLDDARAGLDHLQAERWLAEGQDELRRGAVTAAARLLEQARVIVPDSDAALSLQREIEEIQESRRRERERAEALQRALDQAQANFDAGEYEQAVRACDEALALEPNAHRARQLKAAAATALEERIQRAAEHDARALVTRARGLSGAGRIDDALALLGGAAPHPIVQAAQQELAAEARRLQQEREQEQRAAGVVAEAQRSFAAGHTAAALQRLREFRPARPSIAQAISEIEAAVERRKTEEQEASAAVMLEATRYLDAGQPDRAITMLEEFSAKHRDAVVAASLRELQDRAANLKRQQRVSELAAEARADIERGQYHAALERLRPLGAKASDATIVADLIAEAETAMAAAETDRRRAAHIEKHIADATLHLERGNIDEAQFRVHAALALDPENAPALALKERIAAALENLASEAEFVRDAIARAQAADSHEAAIGHLKQALARDPQNALAVQLLEQHETAHDKHHVGQQRGIEIEKARERAEAHIAAGEWDAAEGVISEVESRHQARKALKQTRALLKEKRKEAARTARDQGTDAQGVDAQTIEGVARPPSRVWPVAAAVIVVGLAIAVGVTYLTTRNAPAPPVHGTAVIDAVPWATIDSIRSADGASVPLPAEAATPMSLALAPGTYEVTLVGPGPARVRRQVSMTVKAGEAAVVAPPLFDAINAEEYLLRALTVQK